jgi:hypothetical protein
MYTVVQLILVALGVALLVRGGRRRRVPVAAAGGVVLIATFLFFQLLDLWGEGLWFAALGLSDRFWTVLLTRWALGAGAAVLAAALVAALVWPARGRRRWPATAAMALGGLIGAFWGAASWETWLRWLHRVPTGRTEPVLGQDVGFYLFSLPFYDTVVALVLVLALVALAADLVPVNVRLRQGKLEPVDAPPEGDDPGDGDAGEHQAAPTRGGPPAGAPATAALPRAGAVLLLALAALFWLDRYHLLGSDWGAVHGAGWTDVHVRLPAYAIVAIVAVILAAALLVPAARRWLGQRAARLAQLSRPRPVTPLVAAGATLAAVWLLALVVVPRAVQWLRVEPNEISLEEPYIARNIAFTREAFGLDAVEEREFPARERFTEAMVDSNPHIFENIRLWDWRALDAVYKQFQEIRLYYEFHDVDIDRYTLDGRLRQVMVSAREMELRNLPEQSQTFVNRRFKYTHGHGLTMARVSEFTSEGLPRLLVRDIPPVSEPAELEVTRPEIYYGELTRDYAVVDSEEPEFDYPRGEQNAYVHYAGGGGVEMSGLWRKLIYGYKLGGTRLLLSGYPREGTRIMFRRQVRERLQHVAPFLTFETDPYVVLHQGRLHWIVDAYTTSARYPYSEPFEAVEQFGEGPPRPVRDGTGAALRGVNYLRNSVKAVVDAYDGTVRLYVFEPEDPLVQVWRAIFPGLFEDRQAMPAGLQEHVRYPVGKLLVQGLVYAKYHMTDPAVFYNQEDLWVRATEKYYGDVQPVEPYYIIWETPDTDQPEFILMLPFTPKNRQVMIGWIAGLSDGANYGRFLSYKFPKERRVIGPQQVETKIDQDRHLSGQLTLWDQRGSRVIRGNVLAIPVAGSLIYVEPIYLQAETAAYPELRLVAVMSDDRLSYAATFTEALAGLYGEGSAGTPPAGPVVTLAEQIARAQEAFDGYLAALGEKRFADAGAALDDLAAALSELAADQAEGASR